MTHYDTPGPVELALTAVSADLTVRASDREDTVVVVTPSDLGNDDDLAAAERTRVDLTGTTLTITGARLMRRFSPTSGGGSIDVTVDLPAGSAVKAEAQVLDVRTTGRLGACRVKTSVGALALDVVSDAELSTTGTMTIGRVEHDATLAGTGRIQVGRVGGRVAVTNNNGPTVVGGAGAVVTARSANGDITVTDPGSDVQARTANGDVVVDGIARGEVDVETSNGRVELALRRGSAAHLDVSTRFGRIDNRLDEVAAPGDAGETAAVRARTSLGDIVLRHADTPAEETV
ncbi:DUF4097 family beta strand repeat-containing protein [Actinomycetospora termitidis]|uniref:DUF4097 family beta strand repeat-containing protein n=1 Tax=Actinomycetospora termitidis TaxID=3053470 RepID=A0ABT7MC18_9PSEU|nr:DUF4097 family beta strand repeat-containing protein [Actinomycetospora sp. Odt1-22]MDL5157382.1 DUF4097 family beta strand repeat-containing protein [Actinomycetospora sp. Odt1-22]